MNSWADDDGQEKALVEQSKRLVRLTGVALVTVVTAVAVVRAPVTSFQTFDSGHRFLFLAAVAVLVISAATAFVVDQSPQTCDQTLACVSRLGGKRCLPGPCDVARHRAALWATEILAVGVLLSCALLLVRHRKLQSHRP